MLQRLVPRSRTWEDLYLFLFRIVLSYGFYAPFVFKLTHMEKFTRWLERLNFSLPEFNAWFVVGMQGAAVVLLALGLCTRLLSLALIFHMAVGLLAVHYHNGFDARMNGYEIPLYYVLFLLALFIRGPGRWSLDHLSARRSRIA